MKTIIWTREAADWEQDREVIGEYNVLRLPCRVTRTLDFSLPANWADFTLCVTSPRAVKHLTSEDRERLRHGLPLLTFGRRTAALLEAERIPVERLPAESGEAFAELLTKRAASRFAILTSREPAYPVAEHLQKAGRPAVQWAIYETKSGLYSLDGEVLGEPVLDRLAKELSGVVCLASPSAVSGVRALLDRDASLAKRLQGVVIGKTTGAACRGIFPFVEAAEPNLVSVFQRALELARS